MKINGFTLLELLLAISLFAVISVVAYSGLNTALQNQQRAIQFSQRTAELQHALQRIEQDCLQILNRSIRNQWGLPEAAVVGDSQQLHFTHNGAGKHALLLGQKRSQLQRVHYQLRDGILIRDYWQVLDRVDEGVIEQKLLKQVTDFGIRYLDKNRHWQSQWSDKLPLAIEISLELEDIGKLKRLFEIINAVDYPAIKAEKPKNKEEVKQ